MTRQVCISREEVERAKQLRDQATTVTEYRKALSIILVADGLDADRAADLLGTSRRTIFRNLSNIRDQNDTYKKTRGGRRNFSMTIEEEREFLSQWQGKASAGGLLTVFPIHVALVERLGHDTPLSTTYRLLARHGWRKVSQPAARHSSKSGPGMGGRFKNNAPKRWLPPV